jgi:signal peptidase II
MRLSPRDAGFLAAALALVLDQGTKLFMLYHLGFAAEPTGSHVIPVLPFFNIVMVWNRGVSYGWLWWVGPTLLELFTMAVVAVLGFWLWVSDRVALNVGLGMVIGGALGNLIDRLAYGKVADFFHFYGHGYDWYVFNVADAAITFGVIALLYDALLKPDAKPGAKAGADNA